MGRYSCSQPSSSEEYDIDITSLLQAEAGLYSDDADTYESDEKLVKVEKIVGELAKKKTGIANGYPLLVCVLVSVVFLICMVVMFKWVAEKDNVVTESLEELQEEVQRMKMRLSDL
ncbi:hypothetical protein IGI04_036815 [Brassica rapa subsp. trilocularis]|uniref:Uncharacterized protein n=1 Tax=Brassica rapa subsp. trilocularis TaxID=1813537 RepID=A0ABQ7LI81_BRACM|nr:hypothetical protein IGI04_036815 [Brassica rapa subsp. trilocularis]